MRKRCIHGDTAMLTSTAFSECIEERTVNNYKQRGIEPSNRGYGITRGKEFERFAVEVLSKHERFINKIT